MKSRASRLGALLGVIALVAIVLAAVLSPSAILAQGKSTKCMGNQQSSKVWSFGVMGDTQWTLSNDATDAANPNSVSVSIINQINQQFIAHGVKFVVQVGDLTDKGTDADIDSRAAAAQSLLNAGIGFYPMRGNHEYSAGAANSYGIPEFQKDFPQTRGLSNTFGASNFSSPTAVSSDLNGMSYSFDYGRGDSKARFVIIDPWVTSSKNDAGASGDGYYYGYSIGDQQNWISSRLDKNVPTFVFSHQPLIAEDHQDSPFNGYTNANPNMQNAFLASLQQNKVKYYIAGHDHMNQRSIVTSPDSNSSVEELICASNSSKFYTPNANFADAKWYGQKTRETSIDQQLYHVGYYIYTIDGPRVTVDYYADTVGGLLSDSKYPYGAGLPSTGVTPTFAFAKVASWGYSLNGKEFVLGGGATNGAGTNHGTSLSVVKDSYGATSACILDGTYANTAKDYQLRPLVETVDTGWTSATGRDGVDSDILTLWGMDKVGTTNTDTYTLAMQTGKRHLGFGVLMAKDGSGKWVKAVSLNSGGTEKFVYRAYNKTSDGLGTYGYDPHTGTAWAVVNHDGSFAIDSSLWH